MKLRCLYPVALALLGAVAAPAQTAAPIPPVTGIAHVAYRVADLDREEAFLFKLGFQRSFALNSKDGKLTETFVKLNDRTFLEVYPQTDPKQELGWLHVCYESDDLANYVTAISGHAGIKPLSVHKAGAGNLITAFPDPDGRNTEFTQYMPGSKHMADAGQHILPNRISSVVEGVEFAVPDMAATRKFYEAMGMTVTEANGGLRVRITAAAAPWIQLSPVGSTPRLFFRVPSLKKAEAQLKTAKIDAKKDKNALTVTDPEGNLLVFVAGK
jgi:catechol 2,3-dioxygenase-like lactoylglutathione lyase family enzyme